MTQMWMLLLLLWPMELMILCCCRCCSRCYTSCTRWTSIETLLIHLQSQTGQLLIVFDRVRLLKARQHGFQVLSQRSHMLWLSTSRHGSCSSRGSHLEGTTFWYLFQWRRSRLNRTPLLLLRYGLQDVHRESGITGRAKRQWP